MSDKKVICWDLDETLGNFRRIDYELMGKEAPELERPTSLRYGLTDLLSSLSSQGYEHVVTTSGTSDYAKEALQRTGLSSHFKDVFGRDVVSSYGGGKKYRPVADTVGLSYEQAVSDMIVIGDVPGDKPVDLDGLVFIEHRGCVYSDSSVTARILEKLNELGDGNFKKGFERMYQDAQVKTEKFGTFSFERRTYEIDEGIKVELKYETNTGAVNKGEEVVPTITNIKAEVYKRDPILVQE